MLIYIPFFNNIYIIKKMSEKKGFVNITNDGHIKKKIISEGSGEKAAKGNYATIRYREYDEENLSSHLSKKKVILASFKIGNYRINQGLDMAIQSMHVGEKSLIIVEQKYINIFNKFKNKNKIIYEIELIKCEKSQGNHSYSERIYNSNSTEKKTKKEQYNYKINIERKNFENFFNKYINKKGGINDIKDNKTINRDKKFTILRNINKIKKTEEKQKSEIIIKYKYGYKNYEDIKLKTDLLICDNCYRLIYISFDFIKNYISTKCPYCYKFNFYNYNNFIEKLKKANNPLLNSFCHKCLKNVNYSQKNFFLIEKPDYIFFIVCEKCINTKEYKDFIKKIEIKNLIEHNLSIYEKNKDLGKIKELEMNYLKEDKNNIINNLKIL